MASAPIRSPRPASPTPSSPTGSATSSLSPHAQARKRARGQDDITSTSPQVVNHDDRPRRISRACLQCRGRKQKCLVDENHKDDPSRPCRRCLRNRFACSFETIDEGPSVQTGTRPTIADLQALEARIDRQEDRLRAVEAWATAERSKHGGSSPEPSARVHSPLTDLPTLADVATAHGYYNARTRGTSEIEGSGMVRFGDAQPIAQPNGTSDRTHSMAGVDTLRLEAPIATLRSLVGTITRRSPSGADLTQAQPWDPVTRGLLSLADASECVHTYIKHCHYMAPFLDDKMLQSLPQLRSRSNLFLAICCVGARLWRSVDLSSHLTTHPRYDDLIKLLDDSLAVFLLHPTSKDVSLESVQALLVTAQWMPMVRSVASPKGYESRYSEMSVWSMLGLAGRHALFLGLEKASSPPFQGWRGDRQTYKTWHNLLTCDANLMMTSGLPPSTYAASSSRNILSLESHGLPQTADDVRVGALLQLAAIAQSTVQRTSALPEIDQHAINRCNEGLDEWERHWADPLREQGTRHDQMPLTSLRWYRLTINSLALRPLLSAQEAQSPSRPSQQFLTSALVHSLDAATYLLVAFTRYAQTRNTQMLGTLSFPTFPDSAEGWSLNDRSVKRLCYALDSIWVTLTFATVFIVLCYTRGHIDDSMKIVPFDVSTSPFLLRAPPRPPRQGSVFSELTTLAGQIYDTVCSLAPGPHPAHELRIVVHSVINSVMSLAQSASAPVQENDSHSSHSHGVDTDTAAVQSLQELLDGSDLQWLGQVWDQMMTGTGEMRNDIGGQSRSAWPSE